MPIDNPDIQPWPLKGSEIAADFKIFKVRSDPVSYTHLRAHET